MEALVSGVAARVVFIDGDAVSYIEADHPEARIPATPDAIPYLLLGAHDVQRLKATSEDEAFRCLLRKFNEDRGLRMLQIVIDPDDDFELRREAAILLNDILGDSDVKETISNWAFSTAFTNEVSGSDIIDLSLDEFPELYELLVALSDHQDDIIRFARAWELVSDSYFSDASERNRFEFAAIGRGVFRKLVEASGDPVASNAAVFDCYLRLGDQTNFRQIISAWTKGVATRQTRQEALRVRVERETSVRRRASALTSIPTETGFVIYQNALRQQEGIKAQLKRGDLNRARRFADQLINWQIQNGGARYAAMSLCALAQEARAFRYYSIQIEWLRRAIELAPEDGRAHGQAGDAYLALFRLDEAYTAYTNAVRFGQEAFGTRGIARVLQATGRLDEALDVCTKARDQFPNDPEAYRTGAIYSEILRDMWKLDEALASYEALLAQYPYEPVIWCGRAAVLKDRGRLFDALDAYSSAIKQFSNDSVAYGGRADVLKDLGRLDEALAAYDDAISRFPENPIFMCGRADVLRSMGNYDAALTAYADAEESFPYEPVAVTGYADVLRDKGNLEEALAHYDDAVSKFPQDIRCRTGRANVLRAAGRFGDALQAYDRNVRDFPYDLFSLCGRAYLLKELAQYDEALKAFDAVIERRKDYAFANYAKAAIYVIMGRFVEAQALLPDTVPQTSAEWVAYHIRGMVCLKQDRLDEALDIFTKGSLQTPFYREQKYFENALAATKIRMRKFHEAAKIVHDAEGAIAHVLQIHSYSELGLREAATTAYAAVNDNLSPSIVMLRDELGARYNITGRRATQSAGWIFEKEMEVLLQAA